MYFEKRTENCDEEESWTGKKEEAIMVSYSLTLSDAEKSLPGSESPTPSRYRDSNRLEGGIVGKLR